MASTLNLPCLCRTPTQNTSLPSASSTGPRPIPCAEAVGYLLPSALLPSPLSPGTLRPDGEVWGGTRRDTASSEKGKAGEEAAQCPEGPGAWQAQAQREHPRPICSVRLGGENFLALGAAPRWDPRPPSPVRLGMHKITHMGHLCRVTAVSSLYLRAVWTSKPHHCPQALRWPEGHLTPFRTHCFA